MWKNNLKENTIFTRAVGSSSHLDQIGEGVIIVHMLLPVVALSIHNDDQVSVF